MGRAASFDEGHGRLTYEARVSVAEDVMHRSGLSGRQWHIPRMHQDHPDRPAAEKPVHDFVHSVLMGAGMPAEHARRIRVMPDHWDLRNSGQGITDGLNYIGVKQHTNDLTLLHEAAHVIHGTDESRAGHGPDFIATLHGLYRQHLGEEAAATFRRIVELGG